MKTDSGIDPLQRGRDIAKRVEQFIREQVIPYEHDARQGPHGPTEDMVIELREMARAAGLMTPHILSDGSHLTHRETALVLQAAGISLLGPLAVNVAAPDEGNMFLLGRVATQEQKDHFLTPLLEGRVRSAFFMTEPAADGGAGSDPSMLKTCAHLDGDHWLINGRKAFITGANGARVGIVMAKAQGTEQGATLFLVDLPDPAIKIERVLDTIDSSMPGGHSVVQMSNLCVHQNQVLGEVGQGFKYAQVRLAPARLTHCMRWLGLADRAMEMSRDYLLHRRSFGRLLAEHQFLQKMLAENAAAIHAGNLMTFHCAWMLEKGLGREARAYSSIAKTHVARLLCKVLDDAIQMHGGLGYSEDMPFGLWYRQARAARIADGPDEVHEMVIAREFLKGELRLLV